MNQMTKLTSRQDADLATRHVQESDMEAISRILQADHVIRGTMRLPLDAPARLAQRMAETPGTLKIVAERKGEVAGLSVLVTYPSVPRHWHCAEIDLVATHPDHRGHGVGRLLMERMIDLADNWLQISRLSLIVWAGNSRAIDLYSSLGFGIEGTMPGYVYLDGGYEDAHMMGRLKPR